MEIRKANKADIDHIADIYSLCFLDEENHRLWIESSFNSFPRGAYYVVCEDNIVCGYILWCVKNGFRANTIIELEQIAVHPDRAGKGLGRKLIETSLKMFKKHLYKLGHKASAIIVTTTEGNYAEKLYRSVLGVTTAALINNYGSGNEVVLYNRSI